MIADKRLRIVPGLVVWMIGLTLGSVDSLRLTETSPTEVVVSMDGTTFSGTMLAGDFHVHSFPGDGSLLPWNVALEARRQGLDVVALTNHNHMLQWRVASAAARWMPAHVLLIPGQEVTAPGFHLAAVGIRRPVMWSRSPRDVVQAVHQLGGVAIAAHPGESYNEVYDRDAMQHLDGVEAMTTRQRDRRKQHELETFYERVRKENRRVAPIGSSDFHNESPLGLSRTYVFASEVTENGVLEALRAGRTAACSPRGEVLGNEPWASTAAPACRAAMSKARLAPVRAGGALNAFAVACAVAGLAAVVRETGNQDRRRI